MESKSANDRNDEWTCDWSQSCPIYDKGKRSETLPCMRCLAEPKERVGEAKLARRLRSYLKRLLVTLGTTDAPHDATPRELADCLNGLVRDLYATYAAGWADSGPRPFGVVTGCACLDAGLFPLGRPAYLCLPPEPGKDTARILRHKGDMLENLLRVVADKPLPKPEFAIDDAFGSIFSVAKSDYSFSRTYIVAGWKEAGNLVSRYRKYLLDARTRQALTSLPDRMVQMFWEKHVALGFHDHNFMFTTWVKMSLPSVNCRVVLIESAGLQNFIAEVRKFYSNGFMGKLMMLPCCKEKYYLNQVTKRIKQLQKSIAEDNTLNGKVEFLRPIILPSNLRKKITDRKETSLETLVLELDEHSHFIMPPKISPALQAIIEEAKEHYESCKTIIVEKVMGILEWRYDRQLADMRKYTAEVERLFKLEYPVIYIDGEKLQLPKLPDFFAKRSQVAPEHQNWHVKPNAKDRHKFNNASYLLALMLAKIDYAIAPETVSEKGIQAEAIGVRRALNRLFELNGRRITGKGRRKTDALPKNAPRLMTLKAWLENHIDHHARQWPPETQEAFDSAFTPDEAGKIFHVDHGEERILIEFVRPNF